MVLEGLEGRRQAAQHSVAASRAGAGQRASPGVLGRGRKAKEKRVRGETKQAVQVREEPCSSRARHRRRWQCFPTLRACHELKRPPFLEFLAAPCPWRRGEQQACAGCYRSQTPQTGMHRATHGTTEVPYAKIRKTQGHRPGNHTTAPGKAKLGKHRPNGRKGRKEQGVGEACMRAYVRATCATCAPRRAPHPQRHAMSQAPKEQRGGHFPPPHHAQWTW